MFHCVQYVCIIVISPVAEVIYFIKKSFLFLQRCPYGRPYVLNLACQSTVIPNRVVIALFSAERSMVLLSAVKHDGYCFLMLWTVGDRSPVCH